MHIVHMTLDSYLTLAGIRTVDFARSLGVDQSYASRIRRGLVVPSAKQMREIFALTAGAVQPNDLVLTSASPAPTSGGNAAALSTGACHEA